MFDGSQLLGFLSAAALLVLTPGPNTVLILAHSGAGGRAAGLATVLGVETATLVHTGAAALGLSAMLSGFPAAFAAVEHAGACYLAWLGLTALRSAGRGTGPLGRVAAMRPPRAYRRALLTNLLNPRVGVFFLAFLPQFVRPERGQVAAQFVVLGLLVSALGLTSGALLALAAGSPGSWLRSPAVWRWQQRLAGLLLVAFSVRLALA